VSYVTLVINYSYRVNARLQVLHRNRISFLGAVNVYTDFTGSAGEHPLR